MLAWSALTLLGMALFYALIRGGWSRRRADPSLTVPQMLFALTSAAVAYALLGAGRAAVFPAVMVVLVFGMFVASPRQMRWVSLYAVGLFGAVMTIKAVTAPQAYPAAIELGHFLLVATMVPGCRCWPAGFRGCAIARAGSAANWRRRWPGCASRPRVTN